MLHIVTEGCFQNGAGTAAPQAAQLITGLAAGVVADMIRSRRCLTTRSTRKLFTLIGEILY